MTSNEYKKKDEINTKLSQIAVDRAAAVKEYKKQVK